MKIVNIQNKTSRPAGQSDDLEIRPARSRNELEQAYRLVHSVYRRNGYVGDDSAGMRVTAYNAFPDTVTFIARTREDVHATVSLIGDTDMGVPMDQLYSEEIGQLRQAGRKVSEVSMLANEHPRSSAQLPVFLRLMKQVFDYAWFVLQADDVCITVHPKHQRFYERRLLFESLGQEKNYPSVQNKPAVAQRLNMRTAKERYKQDRRLSELFFEQRTPVRLLARRHRMTPDDLRYFFVRQTDIFRNATPLQIEVLRQMYPECPWRQWERTWSGGLPALGQRLLSIPETLLDGVRYLIKMGQNDLAVLSGEVPRPSGEAAASSESRLI